MKLTLKRLNKEFKNRSLDIELIKGDTYFYFCTIKPVYSYVHFYSLKEYSLEDWIKHAEIYLRLKPETTYAYTAPKFIVNEQLQKELHVYRLTDAQGNTKITIVNDPSDNGCIGGIGSDGEYHQYDSYELWHAYEWAEKFGMKLESGTMKLDIPDSIFS